MADQTPSWLQALFTGWPMIRANPLLFSLIVLIAIGAIWTVFAFAYGRVLENKNSQIELLERQLSDYREKLKGATPQEAKAKIDALEDKINNTVGGQWSLLSEHQLEKMSFSLKDLPKRRVQVMYSNYLGKDLAKQIADAFTKAGWNDLLFSEGGGLGFGLSTGRGSGMAVTLQRIIEDVTNSRVSVHGREEPDHPGIVFVAVGIKNN